MQYSQSIQSTVKQSYSTVNPYSRTVVQSNSLQSNNRTDATLNHLKKLFKTHHVAWCMRTNFKRSKTIIKNTKLHACNFKRSKTHIKTTACCMETTLNGLKHTLKQPHSVQSIHTVEQKQSCSHTVMQLQDPCPLPGFVD